MDTRAVAPTTMNLTPNQPMVTREPRLVVDAGLPAGRYRFRLVVVDDRGRPSEPAEAVVTISPIKS